MQLCKYCQIKVRDLKLSSIIYINIQYKQSKSIERKILYNIISKKAFLYTNWCRNLIKQTFIRSIQMNLIKSLCRNTAFYITEAIGKQKITSIIMRSGVEEGLWVNVVQNDNSEKEKIK